MTPWPFGPNLIAPSLNHQWANARYGGSFLAKKIPFLAHF